MNEAQRAPASAAPGGVVAMQGYASQSDYESGKTQVVHNVRQAGDQAVYRRGNLWVAANAADIDPDKDLAKIQTVKRFSDEYFELARANSVAENQVLASQQPGEELLFVLRGQAYRIK